MPIVCLHGFLEHAHGFDFVAPRLAAAGHRVLALDLRGQGDSEWVGAGGYYHFPDYVADLALIVRALRLERFVLLGHSMGGSVAIQYAASEPERVVALVTIEGLGPPASEVSSAPDRMRSWISELERTLGREPNGVASLEEGAKRIATRWPGIAGEPALHLVRHNTRRAGDRWLWKFDPLHQTQGPMPFTRPYAESFWSRLRAPFLFIRGGESPFGGFLPDMEERLRLLCPRIVVIPGAGHHPHLEAPGETAAAVLGFVRGLRAEAA